MRYSFGDDDESKYGKGALRNKVDIRDRKWKRLATALPEFNWMQGYDVEDELRKHLNDPNFVIPAKDQNGSLSCVGQAAAYYEAIHDAFEKGVFTEKSARDAYSQIFYPGGGSSTRDAVNLLVKNGVCQEVLMTSYEKGKPPTEGFMEIRPDARRATIEDALTARGTAYANVKIDIDTMAQAIRDNKGIIFVIEGVNNNTWRSSFPKPPTGESQWAHCVYAGKARKIGGKKYLGIHNSWGAMTGENGWQWLGEDYINKNFAYDAMVLYDTRNDVLKQQVAWYEEILSILQRYFLGINTKLIHN